MQARGFWLLGDVSDCSLELSVTELLREGGVTEARVVAHLAEMDARRFSLRRGQSLFEYCQRRLGFSESEAWYRICAARAARKFPIVFELLEQREIHLTTIALIAKHLSEENHRELLGAVRGRTKRQVLELLAGRFPKAGVPSHIRRLPVRVGAVAAGPTGELEPLALDAYQLHLRVSSRLQAKLECARNLMSHANPSGDLAVVVERALDLLLEQQRARRFGQTKRREVGKRVTVPWPGVGSEGELAQAAERNSAKDATGSIGGDEPGADAKANCQSRTRRHIPREVRRQVVARDGGCCSYVGEDGQRCRARAFLELDHRHAWALGGAESADNLRLLCRAHNQFLAEQDFGAEKIRKEIARRAS